MQSALAAFTAVADQIPDLEEQYAACKESRFSRLACDPPVCRETITLLHSLSEFRIGLVTTGARSVVEPVLAASGVLDCFRIAVYGEDVQRHKPAPDAYLVAQTLLGARRILVFEDTDTGVAAARAAGLDVIQVENCGELATVVHRALD